MKYINKPEHTVTLVLDTERIHWQLAWPLGQTVTLVLDIERIHWHGELGLLLLFLTRSASTGSWHGELGLTQCLHLRVLFLTRSASTGQLARRIGTHCSAVFFCKHSTNSNNHASNS